MNASRWNTALGVSVLAMAVAAAPVHAQEAQQDDTQTGISTGEAVVTVGAMAGGVAAMDRAAQIGLNAKPKAKGAAAVKTRIGSLADLKARGEMAQKARVKKPTSLNSLNELAKRGQAAQAARAGKLAGTADEMAELQRRGQTARQARGKLPTSSRNLAELNQRGTAAQRARVNKIGGSASELSDLTKRGNAAKAVRASAGNAVKAARGGPAFERALVDPKGPTRANAAKLVARGDAARAIRGAAPTEGQLMRQIAGNGGDISKLNKAGRSAQVARGAGGIRAASTAADAAKMAKTAKTAKVAKTAATAAKVGKGGRAALAGTGVGAVVVAAEIVGTESVKALTGAELQDPVSTTFQYGAAIFDKDISLKDVMKQRREHHAENFRKLGETFTTKGKLKENLKVYGKEKGEQIAKFAKKVDNADRKVRDGIKDTTGVQLDRVKDTRLRYAKALTGKNKVKNVAKVATDRAKHHTDNVKRASKKVGCGISNIFRKKNKKC